jgi:fructose-1,6-bisphosphatase I
MVIGAQLDACLKACAGEGLTPAVLDVVRSIADAACKVGHRISRGALAGDHAALGGSNADGDSQCALDLVAHDVFLEALGRAPVAFVASEEAQAPIPLNAGAPLAVAIDPLDGSSNVDTNISVGTIFSILPSSPIDPTALFLRPGRMQVAAGFVIYGPQTSLILSIGRGVQIYTLDCERAAFRLVRDSVTIPRGTREYAINASNYRHWDEPLRAYVDDLIQGADGPRGENFNMRWIASLVAEAYRILVRGGIFLYPADRRRGYARGRLRLVYEANPIAFLVEQAGGSATNGVMPILDLVPASLHERTPLVFGSADKVERVARYQGGAFEIPERSPLFGRRGLLRA